MSFWFQNGGCSNKRQTTLMSRLKKCFGAGGYITLCALAAVAQAQDQSAPGAIVRFDISQRFEYSDNPDLADPKVSESRAITTFGVGVTSDTQVSRFRFDMRSNLEAGATRETGLTSPVLTLGYDRDVGHSRLGSALSFQDAAVNSDSTSTVFDPGSIKKLGVDLEVETGADAPFGTSWTLFHDSQRYSGTTDPSLIDNTTDGITGQLLFRFDPRVTGRLTGKYVDYDIKGTGTDRRTTGIGAGLEVQLDKLWQADLSLSRDKVRLTGLSNRTEEGLSVGLRLNREMARGMLSLDLASDVGENGRRDSAILRRKVDLPLGALTVSGGATQTDGLGSNPLYGLDYTRELPRGTFSISLEQSVETDTTTQEEINSSLRISHTAAINSTSRLRSSASVYDSNELGSGADDSRRVDLSLTYERDLTADWDLISGLSHRRSTSDSATDRSSNTVYVGLKRSFDWIP